jgi:ribonuclease R
LNELSKKLRLRGGEKKLAKKILMDFERKKAPAKASAPKNFKPKTERQKREAAQTNYVGMVSYTRKQYRFHPFLQKNALDFQIVPGEISLQDLDPDVIVAAKKIQSRKGKVTSEAVEIVSVLGYLDNPKLDSKMIIWKSGLPEEFPSLCIEEAAELPITIEPGDFKSRTDLRHIPFVTIDGEDARDFDDAVAIDENGDVWVAIADVAHFVATDSALDREASYRGNSYYFPDTVLPMLPEKISNFLCSLRPDEDKLCMAIRIRVNADGTFKYHTPVDGIMRSRARLTYDAVDVFLNKGPHTIPPAATGMLSKLYQTAQVLLKKRLSEGGIDFELSELKFLLHDNGHIKKIVRRSRTPAQSLIEELMLLANRSVAKILYDAKVQCAYRVHDKPSDISISEFIIQLETLDIPIPNIDPTDSRFLNQVLASLGNDAKAKILRQLALRTMKQAYYSPNNNGHFGLGFEYYLHFTSPIRRYSDLVVHRSLKNYIHKERAKKQIFPQNLQSLDNLTLYISGQERVAQRAEFDIRDIKSIRYLSDKIGKVFHGHISSILPSGFFVELTEIPIEGFVHVSRLRDDHYDFWEDQKIMVGRRKKKRWRLADPITIKIEKASLEDMRIDFSLED